VQAYTAKIYIKGAGQILKMPGIIKKQIEKDEDENFELDQVFLTETISELSFKMPSTYKEKVISSKNSGSDNGANPIDFIKASLYEPEVNDVVSPLSPRAFAYYRFSLEGTFRDRNLEINKIKVTPFSRGEDVYEGYVYIIDDIWCLYSAELTTRKIGFDIHYDETFTQVAPSVWLPTVFKFDIKGGIVGIKIEYKYFASISDYKIELNPDLPKDVNLIDEKLTKIKKELIPKDLADVEKNLEEGKEIRRKDLMKYMKKQDEEEHKKLVAEKKAKKEAAKNKQKNAPKGTQDTIRIKPQTDYTTYQIDSNANKRSNEYWNEMRPVPLSEKEIVSYKRGDSIKIVRIEKKKKEDSLRALNGEPENQANTKKRKNSALHYIGDFLLGGNYNISPTSQISFNSFLNDASYNAVEGFVLMPSLDFNKQFYKKDSLVLLYPDGKTKKIPVKTLGLQFSSVFRYSFARETAVGKADLKFTFNSGKGAGNTVGISAGRFVYQLNGQDPIAPIVNTFYAYALGENYMKLYEKDFVKIFSTYYFHQTFKGDFSVELAERSPLENFSQLTLGKGKDFAFESNTPSNIESPSAAFLRHNALTLEAKFNWKPRRHPDYIGEKSDFPEAEFEIRHAIPALTGSNADYTFLQAGFKHQIEVGINRFFGFSVGAGIFAAKKNIFFPDFAHFLGNRTILQTHDRYASFRILDYYKYSTADKFVRAHAHYQFRKFLLTQITPIRFMGWKERFFANVLQTPLGENYLELGFGIDNIVRVFSLEGVTSFQNGKFYQWGIRIGISALNDINIF
jgi:hypothetical protein